MTNDLGSLSFATSIDVDGFQRGAQRLEQIVGQTTAQISTDLGGALDVSSKLEDAFKRLAKGVGVGLSLQQAWGFASQIRDVRAEIQSFEVSFETLLGNKEKADALFSSIREFAVNTPMQLKDLSSAAQLMLSFNIEEDKILPYLKALGDVSMGDTQKFNSLALSFSQMSSAGKLMGQDLMQMINAGFNPLAVMAEKTGKSIAELKDEMSAGKISAEMVQQAFIDATSEGGKFFNMLEKQSKGIKGAMSNLQGAIDDMLNELGEKSEGVITNAYLGATTLVKNWKAVTDAILACVTAYGAYKAVVMTTAAVDKTVNTAIFEAEAAELEKILVHKEADKNADIQRAVASGKITAAKGQEIIAIRAEAAAVVDSLRAKAALAEQDVKNAIAAEATAKRQYLQSVEILKAKQKELNVAEKSGDIFAITAAKKDMETAASERNAAADAMNAAAKDIKTKKEIAAAAAATAETAATNLNTAAETANAKATTFLAIAKEKLIGVTKRLYAVIAANPYALAAAALVLLVYGLYKLCTAQTEAEKAQKRLDEALQKGNAAADAEVEHFKYLFNQLKKTKEGTEEYKNLKDEIIQQYGTYLSKFDLENAKIQDLEKAYDKLTEAIRRSAKQRAMSTFIDEEGKRYAEELGEHVLKAREVVAKALGEEYAKENEELIRRIVSGEEDATEEFYNKIYEGAGGGRAGRKAREEFFRAEAAGRNRTKQWEKAQEEAEYKFGDYSKKPEEPKEEAKSYQTAFDEAKKEWEEAEKKLEDMKASKEKFTEKEYEAARDTAKAAKEKYEKLGGQTKEKKEKETDTTQLVEALDSAQEKLSASQRKQMRERKRFTEDMENDLWQARINSGEYGAKAYIQQRELDFKKEQTQLQRQMEDAIENEVARQKEIWDAKEDLAEKEAKRNGRTYRKKSFDSDTMLRIDFAPGDYYDDEKIGDVDMANIYNITKQYQQMQEMLLNSQERTRKEEVKRQTQAMNEYLAQWGSYVEKRQAIIDITNAKLADTNANLTEGERKSIAAQLTKDLAELDIEASKKTNAISKLFADMSDKSLKELRQLAKDGKDALQMLSDDKAYNADLETKYGITKEMRELWSKSPEELEKIKKALEDITEQADKMESPLKRVEKALDDIFKSNGDTKEFQQGLKDLTSGISDITNAVGVLQKAFSSLGDAFGSDLMSGIGDGLSAATDAVGSAMSGAQAGAVFGPWGAAAGAAIGMVSSLASSLAKLHDAKHEKKIKELQEQADALKKSYDKLGESVEKAYSKDATKLINQQNTLLEQQKAIIKRQIQEEESKKKTDNDRIKQWKEQLEEIDQTIKSNKEKAVDAIFGEDLKSAIDDFASAYANAWTANENRTKSAKEVVKDMMRQMVTESIKAAIQSSSAIEKIRQKLQEFYSDNILQEWEQQAIYTMAEDLQKELDKQFGWADSLMKDNDFQQNGSSGGFQAMTEDTGSELNGRFSAVQIAVEQTRAVAESIKFDTSQINNNVSLMRVSIEELQNIGLLQLQQLENINRNTKALNETNELLERIERNTKNL